MNSCFAFSVCSSYTFLRLAISARSLGGKLDKNMSTQNRRWLPGLVIWLQLPVQSGEVHLVSLPFFLQLSLEELNLKAHVFLHAANLSYLHKKCFILEKTSFLLNLLTRHFSSFLCQNFSWWNLIPSLGQWYLICKPKKGLKYFSKVLRVSYSFIFHQFPLLILKQVQLGDDLIDFSLQVWDMSVPLSQNTQFIVDPTKKENYTKTSVVYWGLASSLPDWLTRGPRLRYCWVHRKTQRKARHAPMQ